MAETFFIKQHDTSPSMIYVIETIGISLVGANIVMNVKNAAGSLVINRREVFSIKDERDALGGPEIIVNWIVGDTAVNGDYEYEFEIEFSDSKIETVPNSSNEKLTVFDDIG